MYKIVRFYFQSRTRRTIKRGLTLDEAKAHCNSLETSSVTCKLARNKRRTDMLGSWFDSFIAE